MPTQEAYCFWGGSAGIPSCTAMLASEIEEHRFWGGSVVFEALCAIPTSHGDPLLHSHIYVLITRILNIAPS